MSDENLIYDAYKALPRIARALERIADRLDGPPKQPTLQITPTSEELIMDTTAVRFSVSANAPSRNVANRELTVQIESGAVFQIGGGAPAISDGSKQVATFDPSVVAFPDVVIADGKRGSVTLVDVTSEDVRSDAASITVTADASSIKPATPSGLAVTPVSVETLTMADAVEGS